MENFGQDPHATNISRGADSSHESHFQGASSHNLVGEAEASFTDGGGIQVEGSGRRFSLNEVLKATIYLDDALIIGTGGFGKVYKGFIHDGATTTVVAMKRLNAESKQGAEEFWTEVKLLSKLRHTHLVSLIGYCNEGHEMILVYEYIARGTLANHLYQTSAEKNGKTTSHLTWEQRLNICLGAARGLGYLHNGTKQGIIHRDVKSTNILLDENLIAKVSDFGLSKSITSNTTTHVSTNVKGTFGYLDPDYFYTNRLTKKSDVYAFGVVLLEVLCGRPPIDKRLEEEQVSLILWAKMYIKKGNLCEIIDPSLKRGTTLRSLKYFAKLANKCLHDQPKERPTMAEVVESLEIALVLHEGKGRSQGTIAKAFQGINLVPKAMGRWWRDGGESSKHSSLKPLSDDLTQGTAESHISPSENRIFSLKEIQPATNGFDQGFLISLDSSFRLYKGCMVGGTLVVVKRYQRVEAARFVKEVLYAEIQVPSLTPHPNIVSLIGFCSEKQELILVYEYMVNGTLSSHLLGSNNNPLPWKKRLEICIDIARGLKYLHTNVEQEVIHRSIKPSNIYLDDKWVAKVAAFELSKPILASIAAKNSSRKGRRTVGVPEYLDYGKLTEKSDVYSLGAVLVDVLCAKKPSNLDGDMLVPWFCACIKGGTIDDVIGPYLIGKIAPECFRNYVDIALSCLVMEPTHRPSMNHVLGRLQSTLQLQAAWENSIEMGDELLVANVPSSYNDVFLFDSEFRIGGRRTCDLVPYWRDGIPGPALIFMRPQPHRPLVLKQISVQPPKLFA